MRPHAKAQAPDCLWKQAGVVGKKQCFTDFNCPECRFDRAMVRLCQDRLPPKKTFLFWQDKLRQNPVQARPCIHHMKGRIDFRACTQSYRCSNCEFDQYFQDRFRVCIKLAPKAFDQIRGYAFPSGYYLSSAHVWVSLQEGNLVSIGVDDMVCRALGPFDRLSLPLTGKVLNRRDPAFVLGRQDGRVSFPSPLTGVVTGANPLVLGAPEQISAAPYTDGWLFTLACEGLGLQIRDLLFLESAADFLSQAAKDLDDFMEQTPYLAAADGGDLMPFQGQILSPDTWSDLACHLTGQA